MRLCHYLMNVTVVIRSANMIHAIQEVTSVAVLHQSFSVYVLEFDTIFWNTKVAVAFRIDSAATSMKAFFTSSLQSFVIIVILYFQSGTINRLPDAISLMDKYKTIITNCSVICQNGWCKPPLSDVSAEVYAVEQATGSYTSYLNNIWYKERSTASFRCVNENHTLIGDSRRVCQYNGTWTGPIPRCGKTQIFRHDEIPM